MVLLAKWLLEHDPEARILVVTDRDELDKQIEGVMKNAGVIGAESPSPRITSRAEFVEKLGAATPRLLCALIHKFDPADLKGEPPPVQGRFYVFVDECHRTQGGDMNKQMKRWLEGAIFIGFTGTPLLRKDKQMTRDVFGTYIHTYKFHEGVADGVILDLKYEARDVPQRLTSQAAIDEWFEQKTKGLNNFQKAVLRKRWATMEELMSAGERKQRIIANIIEDFSLKPRLNNDRGTAILVAASIYDACHYFRLFQNTSFGPYCGIITSYEPNHNAISREPANSDERYKFDTYTQHVLEERPDHQAVRGRGQAPLHRGAGEPEAADRGEQAADRLRRAELHLHLPRQRAARPQPVPGHLPHQPARRRRQGLRPHRRLQGAVRRRAGGDRRLQLRRAGHRRGRRRRQQRPPQGLAGGGQEEARRGPRGAALPVRAGAAAARGGAVPALLLRRCRQPECAERDRGAAHLVLQGRRRSSCAPSPPSRRTSTEAGYSDAEAAALQKEVEFYSDIRSAIKKHSGEELDIKPYEADMRHLLNTYIQADPAADLGELGEMSLTELIIETGIHDAIARKLNEKGKLSRNAIAEGIINNVRKTIIRDQLTDPRFYEQMSKLLDDLIKQSRADAAAYEEFLRKAEALVKRLAAKQPEAGVPAALHGKREATVIYNNLPRILAAGRATAARVAEPPEDEDERVRLALGDRPRHAREGACGLEGRPGARGAGAECAVSAARPRPRGDAGALRAHQEPAGVLMAETIQLGEIAIAVTRKDIKHVHLSVHPPSGRVTLVAPTGTRLEVARAYAISKLGWIRDQQAKLRAQARETPRQFVERESHYLWGRRYLLSVVEQRREALRAARSPPHHAHRAPRQQQAKRAGGHARVAQVAAARRGARADPQVGAEAGRRRWPATSSSA